MYIFNVANPQNITLLGSYPLDPNWANSITVNGSIAYIAEGMDYASESFRGLQIMDVSDPQNPSMISSFPTAGSANWVAVNGSITYLADGESGLLAIDVSTPLNPVLISSYDTQGEAASISINGGVAYVADSGLQIVDISDPQNTNLLGGYDSPGEAYAVQVAGNTAYVADGTAGMQIVDLSNPQNPFLISAYDTPGEARSITVVGNTAYIADSNSGVHVFDVYYPEFPILLGTCPIGASYITVAGNYAYVLDDSHMRIVDVSDVQDPDLMSSYYILGVNSITVNDGIACVANGDLQLVDVSNPLSPAMLGFYATPGYTEFVAVAGNFAYLADSGSGVQIIDISNPAAPTLLSTIPPHHTTSYVSRCQIRGNVLYISDKNWNEISTYDVSVPQTPVLLSRYPWNLSANDIWVDGDRLCTANGEYGLNMYDLDLVSIDDPIQMPPTAFQLRNYPNPFNPETTISYTLPAAGMVSLEIFNSRGQLIRSLLKEEQPAGEHSLIWNGKGDSSHSVASGLYLCRIASNGKQETRKLLLIK